MVEISLSLLFLGVTTLLPITKANAHEGLIYTIIISYLYLLMTDCLTLEFPRVLIKDRSEPAGRPWRGEDKFHLLHTIAEVWPWVLFQLPAPRKVLTLGSREHTALRFLKPSCLRGWLPDFPGTLTVSPPESLVGRFLVIQTVTILDMADIFDSVGDERCVFQHSFK